jgi:plastocyanin
VVLTPRFALRIALPLFVLVTAVLAAACGDGLMGDGMGDMMDRDMGGMHGRSSRGPQTPVVADASQSTVEIRDFDFFPRELTVPVGSVITWVNRDPVPHDATDETGGWATDILGQGEAATLTFDTPGTYAYFCTIHPNMRATLDVV